MSAANNNENMNESATGSKQPSNDDLLNGDLAPSVEAVGAETNRENEETTADFVVNQSEATADSESESRCRKRPLEDATDASSSSAAQQQDGENDEEKGENNQDEATEDDVYKPVYNMPEGMKLEWKLDGMSASLHILAKGAEDEPSSSRELRVCLVGRAKIHVLEGSIDVLGHTIDPNKSNGNKPLLVTSPFWTSWMTIEATSLPCTIEFHSVRGIRSFRVVAPTRPIAIPDEWKSAAQSLMQQFCPSFHQGANPTLGTSPALARTSIDFDDDNMHDAALFDHPRQVCMITGAKGVGKSTFLRYTANRILSNQPHGAKHVAILDADVGQPELAPTGLLRLAVIRKPLLQPPYWNLVGLEDDDNDDEIKIVSSIFYGADTSKSDPTRYVGGVELLMRHYRERIVTKSPTPVPLLINMDGWVKGIGFQILTALVNSLEPTHLVQITGGTRTQTFDLSNQLKQELKDSMQIFPLSTCTTMNEASICRIPAMTWRNFRWTTYFLPAMLGTFDAWDFVSAKELQTGWVATVGSHFRNDHLPEDDDLNDECRLGLTLANEKPFCVPMEAVECFAIGSDFEDILQVGVEEAHEEKDRKHHQILQAMNGCIVALCTNASTMESLGCGILRSIDWRKRLLYVIVPPSIAPSLLPTVKALVKGNLELPFAMLYRGVYAESFAYLTTLSKAVNGPSSTVLGSAPMKSRNNIIRKSTAIAPRK
jgi:polynucleotide 5'-hydroxyl-kinase GRC3/NOL9